MTVGSQRKDDEKESACGYYREAGRDGARGQTGGSDELKGWGQEGRRGTTEG